MQSLPGHLAYTPWSLTEQQRHEFVRDRLQTYLEDPYCNESKAEYLYYTEETVKSNAMPPLHEYYGIRESEIMKINDGVQEPLGGDKRRRSRGKKRAVPPSGTMFDLPPEYFSPDFEDPNLTGQGVDLLRYKKRRPKERPIISGAPLKMLVKYDKKEFEVDDSVPRIVIDGVDDSMIDTMRMVRREAAKMYRQFSSNMTAVMLAARRLAYACQKEYTKRLLRIPHALGNETTYRKLAKEACILQRKWASEQRVAAKEAAKSMLIRKKKEEEEKEQLRQQRKLNFLLTQTELFSHFIGNKLSAVATSSLEQAKASGEKDDGIVEESALTPGPNGATPAPVPAVDLVNKPAEPVRKDFTKTVDFATVDDQVLHQAATANVQGALQEHYDNVASFDKSRQEKQKKSNTELFEEVDLQNPSTMMATGKWHKTPAMFVGELKPYQSRGMNWLASLYETGINGILADEMGLGKTVQSVSFLCHLAESKDTWGPFLVVSPASTLHNWEQEFRKFAPTLRVLPYWGTPTDRGIIRQYWKSDLLGTKEAEFHVMITSYQMVVSDEQYMKRMKWEYLILDEAQSIKSSASLRWKTLLTFKTRNRLLLTGTPIQNSMKELWALLHFIMPSLFDSHDEFKEWFSKDIESHVDTAKPQHQQKATLNERTVQRLHMILKPFMLRRVKKDVERELPQKTELLVPCGLSGRQQHLYRLIRHRVPVQQVLAAAINSIPQNQTAMMTGRKSAMPTMQQQPPAERGPTPAPQDVSFSQLRAKDIKTMDDAQVEAMLADSALDMVGAAKRPRQTESSDENSLMNLVMQFRKVCNHPELFKKRDATYPFMMAGGAAIFESKGDIRSIYCLREFASLSSEIRLDIPALMLKDTICNSVYSLAHHYDENVCTRSKLLLETLSPFSVANIKQTGLLSFLPFIDTSISEFVYLMHVAGLFERWMIAQQCHVARLPNHPFEYNIVGGGTRMATLGTRSFSAFLNDEHYVSPSSMLLISETAKQMKLNFKPELYEYSDPIRRAIATTYPKDFYTFHPVVIAAPVDIVPVSVMYYRRHLRSQQCRWTRNVIMSDHMSRLAVKAHACTCTMTYLSRCPSKYYDSLMQRMFSIPMEAITYPTNRCCCQECRIGGKPSLRPGLQLDRLGCGIYCTASDVDAGSRLTELCHRNKCVPEFVSHTTAPSSGMLGTALYRQSNWPASFVSVPDRKRIVADSGKMIILEALLNRLKSEGHRVLLYCQMTRMMDILEDYLTFRKISYLRLDGTTPITERRNMVHDFQTRPEILVFLMSTRAGGLGINLTSADTVIFYDSDWNPTVDAQAMDRTHRVGQTRPVTVYRLVTQNTIEARILERARVKAKIQAIVISGQEAKDGLPSVRAPTAAEMFEPIHEAVNEREESFEDMDMDVEEAEPEMPEPQENEDAEEEEV